MILCLNKKGISESLCQSFSDIPLLIIQISSSDTPGILLCVKHNPFTVKSFSN